MIIKFRQGILFYQKAPKFVQIKAKRIHINSEKSPTIITFAHGDENYIHKITDSVTDAWNLPQNGEVWPYWEIEQNSGKVIRKTTNVEPSFLDVPLANNEIENKFVWKESEKIFYYYKNGEWTRKLVVFLGYIKDCKIKNLFVNASQVGMNYSSTGGEILFDGNKNPIKVPIENGFKFLTEEIINSKQLYNLKLDHSTKYYIAGEDLEYGDFVKLENGELFKATKTDSIQCIGIINRDVSQGDSLSVINEGYFIGNWGAENMNKNLFLNDNGLYSLDPDMDNSFSVQRLGIVINRRVAYINPDRKILLNI